MTEIARELLEGVNPDDYVKIRYGTTENQDSVEGTITRLSENFLYLQKKDGGTVRIRLDDSLRSLEVIMQSSEPTVAPKKTAFKILKQPVELLPPEPYKFVLKDWLEELRNLIKKFGDVTLKNTAGGLITALEAAKKSGSLSYKYHDLRAKILSMWEDCDTTEEYEFFYLSLGIFAVTAEDYVYAFEPLVRARKYSLAAYSARLAKENDKAEIFALCSLLSGESLAVTQDVAEICVRRKDAEVLRRLLELNSANDETCEKIFACAFKIFTVSGAKLAGDIPAKERAYDAAKKILAAVPESWKKSSAILQSWQEYKNYSCPKPSAKIKQSGSGKLTGRIYSYKPEGHFGWISPNHYFHVRQIIDNTDGGILLRKMLSLNLWNQLEVSFRLGKSFRNSTESAASDVELTAEGHNDALRLINGEESSGVIEAFFPRFMNGRIICSEDGQSYDFKIADIVDPWLRAYYEQAISHDEQEVLFKISGIKRDKATEIRWKNPDACDLDVYSPFVSEGERAAWEKFLAEKNSPKKIISLPEEDPYRSFFYSPLEKWTGEVSAKKPPPLTWNLKASQTVSVPVKSAALRSNYAEQGRRAVAGFRFEEAENFFQQSLQYEGFSEPIFNDLISLYLRVEGKTDQAIELLERYGSRLPQEKLLNNKIRVYEKSKDYDTLARLYEEGIKNTLSVPKRAHYLFSLIGNYMMVKNYEEALKICQRWENFYQQNQFSFEADKLRSNLSNMNRRKAMCLYYLGRLDEAREIATDLMRLNPTDDVANQILDGTLSERNLAPVNSSDEENFDDKLWGLPNFVKYLINQSIIASSLKSNYLQGEEYIGTLSDLRKDLETLVFGSRDRRENIRRTAEMRSKHLFAACKLVMQFEQRGERPAFESKLLAGRAIASWGDSMVSQCKQFNTPRMAYLYALEILHNTEEQDFCNAFNRYLRSFFWASDTLENYISKKSTGRSDGINTGIFAEAVIQPVLMHEFFIGTLQLILALKKTPRLQNTLIDDLYTKNLDLKTALISELAKFLKEEKSNSKAEFERQMTDAVELLENRLEYLRQELLEVSWQFMESSLSEEKLSSLEPEMWQRFLNDTDARRFKNISVLLRIAQDYYSGVNFDNREDCLNRAVSKANDLLNVIQYEPTDLSYNIFKPRLEQIRIKVLDKQAALYQTFQPKLTWSEGIQPFRTREGTIQIQLLVRNDLNCQTAYSLKIMNVQGLNDAVISNLKAPLNEVTLRGGEETEIGFSVEIDAATDKTGSFLLSIGYSYKYSDSPQNPITREQVIEFNFVIRNEDFKDFENPFASYAGGNPMYDATMFFGRDEEIAQIVKMLCPNDDGVMIYGRAIAMYGQTRTGKSSVLFHLKSKLQEKYGDKIWIWDVGNIGENPIESESNPGSYMPIFLHSLLGAALESADENDNIQALIEEEDLEPPLDDILDKPGFATAIFNNYMKKLNRVLEREQKIVVLFFDEFTYLHKHIKNGTISPEFMKFWKALLQKYCIFAVIAGQDDMLEFMRENPNEFACMEPRKLTYLDELAAKQLIREPLERQNNRKDIFSKDGTIDEIYRLTAGSAYLIIVLCFGLVEYLNGKGAYKITRGIFNDFLETKVFCPNSILTEDIHFEPQFKERGHEEFDESNKKILLSIARNSQDTGYANIDSITCDGLTAEEVQALVNRLVDRNVLICKDGNQYSIQVKLLEKWLINTRGA